MDIPDQLSKDWLLEMSVKTKLGAGRLICGFDADLTKPAPAPFNQLHANGFFQNFICFAFVFRGAGTYTNCEGKTYILEPGAAYAMIPGRPFLINYRSNATRFGDCFLCIEYTLWRKLGFSTEQIPKGNFAFHRDAGVILEKMLNIKKALERFDHQRTAEMKSLLAKCQSAFFTKSLLHSEYQGKLSGPTAQLATLSGKLPLAAESLKMPYHKFRIHFRRLLGKSAGAYRLHRRMENACQLLLNHSVKETAAKTLYSDAFNFSRQFKRTIGLTPTRFQKEVLTSLTKRR